MVPMVYLATVCIYEEDFYYGGFRVVEGDKCGIFSSIEKVKEYIAHFDRNICKLASLESNCLYNGKCCVLNVKDAMKRTGNTCYLVITPMVLDKYGRIK